jgi:hypothetical protein
MSTIGATDRGRTPPEPAPLLGVPAASVGDALRLIRRMDS